MGIEINQFHPLYTKPSFDIDEMVFALWKLSKEKIHWHVLAPLIGNLLYSLNVPRFLNSGSWCIGNFYRFGGSVLFLEGFPLLRRATGEDEQPNKVDGGVERFARQG